MRWIYHLVSPDAWNQAGEGPYRADSLATEGFVHCSYREQVARVANQFFADRPELLVDLKLSEASSIYATEKTVAAFDQFVQSCGFEIEGRLLASEARFSAFRKAFFPKKSPLGEGFY